MSSWQPEHFGYGLQPYAAIALVHLHGSGTHDTLDVLLQSGKSITFTRADPTGGQPNTGTVVLDGGQSIELCYLLQRVAQYFDLMYWGIRYEQPRQRRGETP
jgi:hypothetical protein